MSYILEKKLQSIHLVFRGHWERPSSGFASLILRASLVAQMVKSLPVMLETWVLSLGQEDPLEKEMATHSSIFVWKIP